MGMKTSQQEGLMIALPKYVKTLTLKKLPEILIEIFSKLVHVLKW